MSAPPSLTLFDPGEGVVHDGGSDPVGLDVVVPPVQTHVDHLLTGLSHQDIPTVEIAVLKLQRLRRRQKVEG